MFLSFCLSPRSLLCLLQKWMKVNVLIATIYTYTYILLPAFGLHLASIIVQFCVLLAVAYPFTFCFQYLYTLLYLLLHSLSLPYSAPPPPLPYFSPTPAFRQKWATRLGEVWGEKDKESLSPSRSPLGEIGQVLGKYE